MSGWWPLGVTAGLYIWQAIGYWDIGDRALALSFVAYAVANMGFILDFIHKSVP